MHLLSCNLLFVIYLLSIYRLFGIMVSISCFFYELYAVNLISFYLVVNVIPS